MNDNPFYRNKFNKKGSTCFRSKILFREGAGGICNRPISYGMVNRSTYYEAEPMLVYCSFKDLG